jgi:hypothetical protein
MPSRKTRRRYAQGRFHSEQQTADELADLAHAEVDHRPRRRFFSGLGWFCIELEPHCHQESESQHGERDVPIPAVPGANFIVVQTNLLLGHRETFLDCPTQASDTGQRAKAAVRRAENHVVGHLFEILAIAPDQQPALPLRPRRTRLARQTQARPVVNAFALRPGSGRVRLPGTGWTSSGQFSRRIPARLFLRNYSPRVCESLPRRM